MWIILNYFQSFPSTMQRCCSGASQYSDRTLTLSYPCRNSPQHQTGPCSIQRACEGSLTRWRDPELTASSGLEHSVHASTSISNLKGSCVHRSQVQQTVNYSWVPQSSTDIRRIHLFHIHFSEIYITFTCKHR